jgi:hypothetical protein
MITLSSEMRVAISTMAKTAITATTRFSKRRKDVRLHE